MSFSIESKTLFSKAVKEKDIKMICGVCVEELQSPVCEYFSRTYNATIDLVEDSMNSFLYRVIENNNHPIFKSRCPFRYMMKSIKNSILDEIDLISRDDASLTFDTFIDYVITDTEDLDTEPLDETRLYVQEAIDKLPSKQKRVIKYLLSEVEFDFIKGDFQSNATIMAKYFNDTSASTVRVNKKKAYESFKKLYIEMSGGGI